MSKDILACVAGALAGLLVFAGAGYMYKPKETAIAPTVEVTQECVEIIEYDMKTGDKTLVDCIIGE